MIRLGLCCLFRQAPITFQTARADYVGKLKEPLSYLSLRILHNVSNLEEALKYCANHCIGDFRVTSRLFPLMTHPTVGYTLEALPHAKEIAKSLEQVKCFAKKQRIRLTFHPDPFIVLSSPQAKVVDSSLKELEYHAFLAQKIGADVINIHAGGVYGDKAGALERLKIGIGRLSAQARSKLTLENDDRSYTPQDLIPFCMEERIPFCYDAHHHRCLTDEMTLEEATHAALKTWNREPLFHISSAKEKKNPRLHHDLIDIKDFPACWKEIPKLTVEVEAKAKEVAVEKLYRALKRQGALLWP